MYLQRLKFSLHLFFSNKHVSGMHFVQIISSSFLFYFFLFIYLENCCLYYIFKMNKREKLQEIYRFVLLKMKNHESMSREFQFILISVEIHKCHVKFTI